LGKVPPLPSPTVPYWVEEFVILVACCSHYSLSASPADSSKVPELFAVVRLLLTPALHDFQFKSKSQDNRSSWLHLTSCHLSPKPYDQGAGPGGGAPGVGAGLTPEDGVASGEGAFRLCNAGFEPELLLFAF
jgi:hypothetical protein